MDWGELLQWVIKLLLNLWVAFANSIVWSDKRKGELMKKGYEEKKRRARTERRKCLCQAVKWSWSDCKQPIIKKKTMFKVKLLGEKIICWYRQWVPDNSCWSCFSSFMCQPWASDRRMTACYNKVNHVCTFRMFYLHLPSNTKERRCQLLCLLKMIPIDKLLLVIFR